MNDLLKSINLRLNNPFILSFVISWIFWNWPIVVGLLWYNAKTLQLYGYSNYKALILDNADVWKNYILPLCFAIAYPYLKLAFSALQTTVNAIDERTTKRISGKGYIPTQKFLDLREQYETNIQKLSDVINRKSKDVGENMTLKTQLTELNVQISSLQNELKKKNGQILSFQNKAISTGVLHSKDTSLVENKIAESLDVIFEGKKNVDVSYMIKDELKALLHSNGFSVDHLYPVSNNLLRINFIFNNVFESVFEDTIRKVLFKHPSVLGVEGFNYYRFS